MLRRTAAAAFVVLLAVPVARAQNLAEICRRQENPPVGAWSEFRVVGGPNDGATERLAVVGTETRADTSYQWIEFSAHGYRMSGSGDTTSVVMKGLARGGWAGMAQPRELIMKIGTAPAMEMPVGGPDSGSGSLDDCANSKVVGWESVTVPAGTFRALHIQDDSGGGDAWVVPDLPFGMIKGGMGGTPGDSGQMVLVAHGMGAKSAITETPRPAQTPSSSYAAAQSAAESTLLAAARGRPDSDLLAMAPMVSEDLTFSGAVSGKMTNGAVVSCGVDWEDTETGRATWLGVSMSGILGGALYTFKVEVGGYSGSGAGTFTTKAVNFLDLDPTKGVAVELDDSISFASIAGGTITVTAGGKSGTVAATLNNASPVSPATKTVKVTGKWSCP